MAGSSAPCQPRSRETDGYGCTVRTADFVTPAPETEIVTSVGAVTAVRVKMRKLAATAPDGTVTLAFVLATVGLLLASVSVTSPDAGDASRTTPDEPFGGVVVVVSSVMDAGGCPGVSVSVACWVTPFRVAPSVTAVFAVTAPVGMLNENEASPGATVTVAGRLARAGLLLVRATERPPAGACPFSITIPEVTAPPVIGLNTESDLSDGGCTVKLTDADDEPSVAVSVTGVAAVTCPAWKRNWSNAKPAATVKGAGTGAAVGLLLARLMTAPPDGAGPVS